MDNKDNHNQIFTQVFRQLKMNKINVPGKLNPCDKY